MAVPITPGSNVIPVRDSGVPLKVIVTNGVGGSAAVVGQLDEVATTVPAEDATATLRITAARSLHTTLRDANGVSAMDNAANAVRVNVVAGSSGGPSKVDDAAFAVGVDSVAPMGAMLDDSSPDTVNEGDVGIPRMSAARVLYGQIRDAAGNERGVNVNASNQLEVNASITGTVSLPTGASTAARQDTQITSLQLIDDVVHTTNAALSSTVAIGGQLDDAGTTAATENNVASLRITAQRGLHANLRNAAGAEVGTATSPVFVVQQHSSTATLTNVSASATSVTLLSANSARLGAIFFNETTTGQLYLKFGSTASVTSFTARISPSGYYELSVPYDGRIDGIWSAADGTVRITELTP